MNFLIYVYIVIFIANPIIQGYLLKNFDYINKMNKENKEKEVNIYRKYINVYNILFIVISFLINYFLLIPIGKYFISILFYVELILSIIILCIINISAKTFNSFKIFIFLHSLFAISLIIITITSSTMFRAKEYRDLIPNIKTKTFSKEITPFDVSKAPIVTKNTAYQIADKKIGSLSNIGSKAYLGNLTLQNVNNTLYWVAPLEYNDFWAWRNNKNEGTPYIMVNANNKECKLIKKNIKYQPNACFSQNLQRILYNNNKFHDYMDFTFEIDDNGIPYWTASTYINKIGIDGTYITGIALVNAETGEIQEYSLENVPKWVDRIQPQNIVNDNLDYKGQYIHGFKLFNDNDKTVTSPGIGIVYNDGKCYYYTGVTSIGGDQSSLGFYLVDTRTMETTFYSMNGATEEAAMKSAEGKVQNLNYTASFPILLNIENNPTYLIALNDKNKLTKLYAMVNVQDYSIISIGENINDCQKAYIRTLSNKNQLKDIKGNKKNIIGTIERINSYIQDGNTYYNILLKGSKLIFTVPCNQNIYLPITKENDKVKIEFINTLNNNNIINANNFTNLSLQK